MKPRRPVILLAFAGLLVALRPGAALAAERGCPAPTIEPDTGFRARFPDLLERVQSELSSRPDVDACARVELRLLEGAVIAVSVALPDGRAASREVRRREDVIPTLQALLLLPGPAPAALSTTALPSRPLQQPPPPLAPKLRAPHPDSRLSADRDALPSRALAARQLGFELSVVTGARIGDGQLGYGAGVLSFLEVKSFLLGFEGRIDGYRTLLDHDPETALELAILAGKRFDFDSVALDLTAGAGVAMKGIAFSQTESAPVGDMPLAMPSGPRSEPSTGPVPRLLLGARVGFSPRSVFRTFVGIDGELGPARANSGPGVDERSARLPRFTIGLALGATVGSR